MKKLTKTQVISKLKKLNENESLEVTLFPSKCGPSNTVWVKGIEVPLTMKEGIPFHDTELHEETFDSLVNRFSYYNCNSELGNRVHFYIKE